jgi:CubicO group peptidase (beta-lactamase class C family)
MKKTIILLSLFSSTFANATINTKLDNLLFNDKRFKTKTALIIKDGKVIYDRSEGNYNSHKKQRVWSATKSVAGTLIGIAEKQGLLNRNDFVSKYYPEVDKRLTIGHLLTMSSGLKWQETYEGNPLNSDVLKMLYISNYKDMATFASKKKQLYSPGEFFNYSSGESNFLIGILQKILSKSDYENFPWRKLFTPLGIENVTWERDHKNNYVASSYLYISPRDLSKIGQLYLQKGTWEGKQIFMPEWVDYSTTNTQSTFKTELKKHLKGATYGAQWWLNREHPKYGKKHKNGPDDILMALGHHGQSMTIIPTENMIIVRTADDRENRFNLNDLFTILFDKKYLKGASGE